MRYELTAEEICRRLRPVMGDRIDKIYLKYALSENNQEKIEMEQALKILYAEEVCNRVKVLLRSPLDESISTRRKYCDLNLLLEKRLQSDMPRISK